MAGILTEMGVKMGVDYDVVGFQNTPWAKVHKFASIDIREDLIASRAAAILVSGERVDEKITPRLKFNNGGNARK